MRLNTVAIILSRARLKRIFHRCHSLRQTIRVNRSRGLTKREREGKYKYRGQRYPTREE